MLRLSIRSRGQSVTRRQHVCRRHPALSLLVVVAIHRQHARHVSPQLFLRAPRRRLQGLLRITTRHVQRPRVRAKAGCPNFHVLAGQRVHSQHPPLHSQFHVRSLWRGQLRLSIHQHSHSGKCVSKFHCIAVRAVPRWDLLQRFLLRRLPGGYFLLDHWGIFPSLLLRLRSWHVLHICISHLPRLSSRPLLQPDSFKQCVLCARCLQGWHLVCQWQQRLRSMSQRYLLYAWRVSMHRLRPWLLL